MHRFVAVACVSLTCLWTARALALDASIVSTARELGEQGLRAYDEGRYDEAASKLLQAYQAVKVPTLGRDAARALVKQRKLLAAAELYLEATRLLPNELWHGSVQQAAQGEADREREALLPLIPRLKIVLDGATARDTVVTLDDVTVPEPLVGSEQFADPGKHQVVATHEAHSERQDIALEQGQRREVVLRFTGTPPSVGNASAGQMPHSSAQNAPTTPHDRESNTMRTVGWIGVGVGAAGVALGTTTGIIAIFMRSGLRDDGCVDYTCRNHAELQGRVNTYNSLLPVTTVGFVVGGVAAAAGVTLLLTSPRRESQKSASLELGPGSMAIQGEF
jgi:hypothetical protein